MRLLITGPLGHIGSRLIHSLKPHEFDHVVLIDNFSTQRYATLFNLPPGVSYSFVEADICTDNLEKRIESADAVIHLAAITDATTSFEKKELVENVNLLGTQRVAQACVNTGKPMIFTSTTSVYGPLSETVDETCADTELKPQSPYAEFKLKAEQYLTELGNTQNLHFVICRLGTIFGTSVGMRFHTAVNKFCFQAVLKQPISVWRTALHQKRPYLDLEDAIRAFKFIIETNLFDNSIYNVVTTNTTVNEIVSIISTLVPDISVNFVDTAIMNQLSFCVSSEKFKSRGFEFKGDIRCGIRDTIELLKGLL
jgi:nucleoside-diphosphate-sugar epimerase